MFILAVEESTLEVGLQRLGGTASDVMCDVGSVGGPKVLS